MTNKIILFNIDWNKKNLKGEIIMKKLLVLLTILSSIIAYAEDTIELE